MPFFNNFEEGLRVHDLASNMQNKLEVSDEQTSPSYNE
jgi:hypothetical protein